LQKTPKTINRRTFVSGGLSSPESGALPPRGDIASVLVQTRPEHLGEVEVAIAALAGCEIHARDSAGKLVVVIDVPDTGVVGTTLNTIALTPHVLSAALVFHAIDTG
jgi:nitrate reductase NapD